MILLTSNKLLLTKTLWKDKKLRRIYSILLRYFAVTTCALNLLLVIFSNSKESPHWPLKMNHLRQSKENVQRGNCFTNSRKGLSLVHT